LCLVAGCELLDMVLTNDYLLIMTNNGIYASNDMRDSDRVNGVRMSPLNYSRGFDPTELGCSVLEVGLQYHCGQGPIKAMSGPLPLHMR